jgi:hypothetical protein
MKKIIFLLSGIMLSISAFGQADKDLLIVSSFSQGSANNCASIALIKAAMLKYGYKNMFGLARNGDNFKVTLKDGTQFTITDEERKSSIRSANFKIPSLPTLGAEKDSILFYAYIAYASIAKFIVAKGYWGCEEQGGPHFIDHNTYTDALFFISRTSFCTDYCNRLLGYKAKRNTIYDFVRPADANQRGTILYSAAHAVVAYNDHLDCHGSWVPITTTEICSNDFKWYIVLD